MYTEKLKETEDNLKATIEELRVRATDMNA